MSRKAKCFIGDADKIIEDDEFPSCSKCDNPIVFFWDDGGLGYTMICTNHDCENGFPKFADNQISGTRVHNNIEEEGREKLKKEIDELREKIDDKIIPIMNKTEADSDDRREKLSEKGFEWKDV